jgi:hypothetical protein
MAGRYKWEEAENSTEEHPHWVLRTKVFTVEIWWAGDWRYKVDNHELQEVVGLPKTAEKAAKKRALQLQRAGAESVLRELDEVERELYGR